MKHALVTGGAGFIGSHLVDLLLDEGWQVTVVDSFDPFYDPRIKRQNVAPHLSHPNYTLVEADIRNTEALRKRLSGEYDAIVHLAARAGVRPSVLDPASYYEVNVRGTLNLLELAKEWGVQQFVFASSSSVYGANPNLPWREDDSLLLPVSPYGATKLAGEALGRVYSHLYGIRFIALRIFTAYGPRQRPDLAIHKFARLMLEGKPIPVYGDGSARRDYTYIGDLVRGIRAAMDYEGAPFEVFNLGSGRPITVLEVVRAVEEVLGKKARIEHFPVPAGDVPHTWADVEKAEQLLGYIPKTSFSEGLFRFVESLNHASAP
ncbi:GDP-mannose 4,6-dehydratase [Candidatus Caldatribacterium sp. SIUC1]|uniref:GDP-mannose 4,6-dehydratase n=1 Tax=Candidatus Caldatribacterium sp. SIUC1 TaxID=3418365 RepID=UPI003F690A7C